MVLTSDSRSASSDSQSSWSLAVVDCAPLVALGVAGLAAGGAVDDGAAGDSCCAAASLEVLAGNSGHPFCFRRCFFAMSSGEVELSKAMRRPSGDHFGPPAPLI